MHSRTMSAEEAGRKVICLSNLPYNLDERSIGRALQDRGLSPAATILLLDKDNEPTGRAGVFFEDEADQIRALQSLDGALIDGRQITAHP